MTHEHHHENEAQEVFDDTGVHASHCCVRHGCKYGDEDCPVVIGKVAQMYDCEDCEYEKEKFAQDAGELLQSPENLARYLQKLQAHTKNPLILNVLAQACESLENPI